MTIIDCEEIAVVCEFVDLVVHDAEGVLTLGLLVTISHFGMAIELNLFDRIEIRFVNDDLFLLLALEILFLLALHQLLLA